MPVPTKPNEQRIRHDGDFTWEQFAKYCLLNKYVLVVGSEAILNRDVNPEAEGDSMKLLFDLVLRHRAEIAVREEQVEEEYIRLKRRYKSFTELVRELNNVRELVVDTIRDNDFVSCFDDEIEPSLMRMLQTKCFRIVLATSIDPYLEIAMEKVWGKGGFDVVQIENAQQSFKQVTLDEFGVLRPTLCYVFGKVDVNKSLSENRFVLSENDAMEKISSWFENHRNNSFLKYVSTSRLISVGCKFDDWMFRFFWYLLRGRVSTEADGQVAVEIKNDDRLKQYLENEKVKVFPNARLFMNETADYINKATDMDNMPRKENGVFISYAHEDRHIALRLFDKLSTAGVNVWIDEENLEGGDRYKPRIQKAIATCKIFMPVLSSQVKTDITDNMVDNRWYSKEWRWAQERYDNEGSVDDKIGFKVIPIVMGDYRFNELYHQKVPKCISDTTAFETAKDSIDHLIKLING